MLRRCAGWIAIGTSVAGLGLASARAAAVAIVAPPAPTLTSAGAETCKLDTPVSLGPSAGADPVVAFGAKGGLVAWLSAEKQLSLRPLASDGTLAGAGTTVAIGDLQEPKHLLPLDRGFVVLLVRRDWQRGRMGWYAVWAASAAREAKPPVDLDLADMDVAAARPLDDHRIELEVRPSGMLGSRGQRRDGWQLVTVDADGRIVATPAARSQRVSARPASDAVVATITNLAQPIPRRGPDGRTYEPLARPALARELAGHKVGQPTLLELRGNPAGAHGFMISSWAVAWTGTHFLYPFRDSGWNTPTVAMLLPVDCRPRPSDAGAARP
jgi:hypothetical protein